MTELIEQIEVDSKATQELLSGFGGQVIAPRDPAYEERRRVWNGSIDRHPALISRCAGWPM